MSVIKLVCAFMQISNKHLIFCICLYEKLWGGCIFPSICQFAITGKKRRKMRFRNQKDVWFSLFLLSLILVGLLLVFSLKWLSGELGDYSCVIRLVQEVLLTSD